ncbi:MAG: YHYH protein [Magnetococcus sp. THC-1_WYH]
MTRKHGITTLFLGALLGTVASQTAYAAADLSSTTSSLTISGQSFNVYTVTSDGVPYYGSGYAAGFPSLPYNHTPAAVSHTYLIPATPALNGGNASSPVYTPLGLANDFGVALDGIPFDPLTSFCGGDARSASNSCSYRLEARLQTDPSSPSSNYTTGRLGFDVHNGHSQLNPNAYHYHGIPCGIAYIAGGGSTASTPFTTTNGICKNDWSGVPATATIVGYAKDGYPIVIQKGVYSSYSVVTTAGDGRPTSNASDTTNALGNWSADMNTLVTSGSTFTQANLPSNKTLGDFTYTGPSTVGTATTALGLCNETANTDANIKTLDGQKAAYAYYLTPNFPMTPRCLIGVTDGPTENTQGFYHAGGTD